MAAISDAVVIGLVLTLVFAAASYYLYSQIGQLSHKVGLMENILLDLKVATEQAVLAGVEPSGFSSGEEDHFHSQPSEVNHTSVNNVPESQESGHEGSTRELFVESRGRADVSSGGVQVERLDASPSDLQEQQQQQPSLSVNYEAMTYKELLVIARQKNLHGTRSMTKAQLIDALRGGASSVEVKKDGAASLSNWTSSGTVSFNDELGSADDQGAGAGGILSLDDTSSSASNLVGSD